MEVISNLIDYLREIQILKKNFEKHITMMDIFSKSETLVKNKLINEYKKQNKCIIWDESGSELFHVINIDIDIESDDDMPDLIEIPVKETNIKEIENNERYFNGPPPHRKLQIYEK
jgi:hypothetical protein